MPQPEQQGQPPASKSLRFLYQNGVPHWSLSARYKAQQAAQARKDVEERQRSANAPQQKA